MTSRRLRRYVEDLLRGRRPHPFPADPDESADLRTALTLRAARPGSTAPSEEFIAGLHRRLTAELAATEPPAATRRRVVKLTAAAAATAAVSAAGGAALDHALTTAAGPRAGPAALTPIGGTWHTVGNSAD